MTDDFDIYEFIIYAKDDANKEHPFKYKYETIKTFYKFRYLLHCYFEDIEDEDQDREADGIITYPSSISVEILNLVDAYLKLYENNPNEMRIAKWSYGGKFKPCFDLLSYNFIKEISKEPRKLVLLGVAAEELTIDPLFYLCSSAVAFLLAKGVNAFEMEESGNSSDLVDSSMSVEELRKNFFRKIENQDDIHKKKQDSK